MTDSERIKAKCAAKRLREMMADPYDRAHGTSTGYDYGCRCKWCAAAKSEEGRRRWARMSKKRKRAVMERRKATRAANLERMQSDPADPRHGTATGYGYGCRCYRCCYAKSEQMRYYNRKGA